MTEEESVFFESTAYSGNGYYCPYCRQENPGYPKQYRANDLGILSGRAGVVTECRKCGYELDFFGMRA